jgi:hypothetical protein
LAGSVVIESPPKWKAIRGAVESVAEIVIAAASASARRKPPDPVPPAIARRSGAASRRIPSSAAKLSCQPISAAMRGSTASVTIAATASAWRREERRPARVARTLSAPMIPAR